MVKKLILFSCVVSALMFGSTAQATSLFGPPDVIICDAQKAGVLSSRKLAFIVGAQIAIPGDPPALAQVIYGTTDPLGTGPKDRWVLMVSNGVISQVEVPSGYTTSNCVAGTSIASLQAAGRTRDLPEIAIGGPGASVPGQVPVPGSSQKVITRLLSTQTNIGPRLFILEKSTSGQKLSICNRYYLGTIPCTLTKVQIADDPDNDFAAHLFDNAHQIVVAITSPNKRQVQTCAFSGESYVPDYCVTSSLP